MDDVGGGEGEFVVCGVGAVVFLEIEEAFVHLRHLGGEFEDDVVFIGYFHSDVGEDFVFEIVLFFCGEGFVGEFRGEGDELCAFGFNLGERILEGDELDIAIGAPAAAIPGEDDGALFEERGEGDLLTGGVFEGKGGCFVSDIDGFVDDARFGDGFDACGKGFFDVVRGGGCELGLFGRELIGEGGVFRERGEREGEGGGDEGSDGEDRVFHGG